MRPTPVALPTILIVLISSLPSFAQSPRPIVSPSVPRVINISGVFRPADGGPTGRRELVTLGIYADEAGGTPLWQETQSVDVDAAGRYTLLLGATQTDGVPLEVFGSGEARWLGLVWGRAGEIEGPRTRLTMVPYAIRASDAELLGGKPASAYLLAPTAGAQGSTNAAASPSSGVDPLVTNFGTTNSLAKYVNPNDLGSSAVSEDNGKVGIGTTSPFDSLHVRFSNGDGTVTGYAVQNLGNTAASYSGMLFYDQTGALGQFQGFNNATHEYRINNIAKDPMSAFNGSINFMIGSTSAFLVDRNRNIGVGTTAPEASIDVVKDTRAGLFLTSHNAEPTWSALFEGKHARGTAADRLPTLAGDYLATFRGSGFNGLGFNAAAEIDFIAAENYANVQPMGGADIGFATRPTGGSNSLFWRMYIQANGNVGIGTTSPQSQLHLSGVGGFAPFVSATIENTAPSGSNTPAALDLKATFQQNANWRLQTGTSLGTTSDLVFYNLSTGNYMVMQSGGNVGIGTTAPADKLHVNGEIRVASCVKNSGGTPIAGLCISDARFKRSVTPFGPVLPSLTALQPVHYYWRATEFPERHFDDNRSYGLIAQDVERVLPELVVTGADGYRAVDYSKLPLLTIQALKELNVDYDATKSHVTELKSQTAAAESRIDELTAANDALKNRVAELERLIRQLAGTMDRRPR